jgi:hypothetical protein
MPGKIHTGVHRARGCRSLELQPFLYYIQERVKRDVARTDCSAGKYELGYQKPLPDFI